MRIFLMLLIGLSFGFAEAASLFKPRPATSDYGVDQDGTANSSGFGGSLVRNKPDTGGFAGGSSDHFKTTRLSYPEHKATFDCQKLTQVCPQAPATCETLKSKMRNGEALDYTLEYFVENFGHLQDSSCMRHSSSMEKGSMPSREALKGIQTGKFVLNDLDTQVSPTRSEAHFVNLCSGDIKRFTTKRGTGTIAGRGYEDKGNSHTSLAGAFLTDSKSFEFVPYGNNESFSNYVSGLNGKTGLRLIGLNSSNNNTEYHKPLHVSPGNATWGCIGIDREDADVITKLTEDHKSALMMSYSQGHMQKLGTGASCVNDSSGSSSSSRAKGGQ